MARILVQTNDQRTVLDERNVHLADLDDTTLNTELLARLEHAIRESQRARRRASRPGARPAGVTPVKGYLELNG